jgi:hypothetical protein
MARTKQTARRPVQAAPPPRQEEESSSEEEDAEMTAEEEEEQKEQIAPKDFSGRIILAPVGPRHSPDERHVLEATPARFRTRLALYRIVWDDHARQYIQAPDPWYDVFVNHCTKDNNFVSFSIREDWPDPALRMYYEFESRELVVSTDLRIPPRNDPFSLGLRFFRVLLDKGTRTASSWRAFAKPAWPTGSENVYLFCTLSVWTFSQSIRPLRVLASSPPPCGAGRVAALARRTAAGSRTSR